MLIFKLLLCLSFSSAVSSCFSSGTGNVEKSPNEAPSLAEKTAEFWFQCRDLRTGLVKCQGQFAGTNSNCNTNYFEPFETTPSTFPTNEDCEGALPPGPICKPGCLNGGTCTVPNTCLCPPEWTGVDCSESAIPICNPPCQNNATCEFGNQCTCTDVTTGGDRCQFSAQYEVVALMGSTCPLGLVGYNFTVALNACAERGWQIAEMRNADEQARANAAMAGWCSWAWMGAVTEDGTTWHWYNTKLSVTYQAWRWGPSDAPNNFCGLIMNTQGWFSLPCYEGATGSEVFAICMHYGEP